MGIPIRRRDDPPLFLSRTLSSCARARPPTLFHTGDKEVIRGPSEISAVSVNPHTSPLVVANVLSINYLTRSTREIICLLHFRKNVPFYLSIAVSIVRDLSGTYFPANCTGRNRDESRLVLRINIKAIRLAPFFFFFFFQSIRGVSNRVVD